MKLLNLFALFSLISCSHSPESLDKEISEQLVSEKVDINRFMGDWFVIASIPTYFEKGAYNAIENYTYNEKEQRIDVTFSYNQDSFTGEKKVMTQKGWVQDHPTNAYWQVRPLWPLLFDYLIIDLASDYSWTVVGVPDRSYVWIMARDRKMNEVDYEKALKRIEELGYDLSKLKRVPQQK